MSDYAWDFANGRVSFRRGGRIVLVHRDGTEEPIAPEDHDRFTQQFNRHLRAVGRRMFDDPRWQPSTGGRT